MLRDEIEKVLEELIDITKGSHISDEDWIKREISQALTRILELMDMEKKKNKTCCGNRMVMYSGSLSQEMLDGLPCENCGRTLT